MGFDVGEVDITDTRAVTKAITDLEPHAVIHCAAYTNVDGAESDEQRAMEVNAKGAGLVARSAQEIGAVMAHVSTDYVFDGEKRAPYVEEDLPRPLSSYGRSKLEGEREVVAACPDRHIIVRTAWLYGVGKGFADWIFRGLESGSPLRLVADHRGSPTYAADLAGALLRLVEQGHRGTYHFVNRGETSWLEWGQRIAELAGRSDTAFEAVEDADLGRPAPRPAYSVLSVSKYEDATGVRVPTWQDGLERYMKDAGRTD
jgi:dTDP-4-dehydrorhamnose reductase